MTGLWSFPSLSLPHCTISQVYMVYLIDSLTPDVTGLEIYIFINILERPTAQLNDQSYFWAGHVCWSVCGFKGRAW